jgi:hypothetical protein
MNLVILFFFVLCVTARNLKDSNGYVTSVKDSHGCVTSDGYRYCEYLEDCLHFNKSCKVPKFEFPKKSKEYHFKIKVFHLLL